MFTPNYQASQTPSRVHIYCVPTDPLYSRQNHRDKDAWQSLTCSPDLGKSCKLGKERLRKTT